MNTYAFGLQQSGQGRLDSDANFASHWETRDDIHGWGPAQLYPANTEVFHQDAPANAVYLIERGLVKLTWVGPEGQELIQGLRRRHWLAGTPAVLLERPFAFTVTTLTPCSLRCISATRFLELVNADAEFCRQLLRMLSERVLDDGMRIAALGCMPAKDRLDQFFRELILEQEQSTEPDLQKKPMRLHIPLKLKELAQLIAITPEYLSRLLSALEQEGTIRRDKGGLVLTDPVNFLAGQK
jgi:CRP-like cAMP-binding protein